jgi:Fe-S-cluster containining protein
MGTPPASLFELYPDDRLDVARWLAEPSRLPRLTEWAASLPPELLAGLLADRRRVELGGPCRGYHGLPCLWLDPQTRTCRHYEHRPEVCREFEVGSADCRRWRRHEGIA